MPANLIAVARGKLEIWQEVVADEVEPTGAGGDGETVLERR